MRAIKRATKPGKYSLLCQSPKIATAMIASGPTRPPPTLCATFQIDILVPLSFVENQCTITRPEAGHPIPWNHPLINSSTNIIVSEPVPKGKSPIKIIVAADKTIPPGKNAVAVLLSQTFHAKNLLRPYAIDTPERGRPKSPLLKPWSIKSGIAREKFFLTK